MISTYFYQNGKHRNTKIAKYVRYLSKVKAFWSLKDKTSEVKILLFFLFEIFKSVLGKFELLNCYQKTTKIPLNLKDKQNHS